MIRCPKCSQQLDTDSLSVIGISEPERDLFCGIDEPSKFDLIVTCSTCGVTLNYFLSIEQFVQLK